MPNKLTPNQVLKQQLKEEKAKNKELAKQVLLHMKKSNEYFEQIEEHRHSVRFSVKRLGESETEIYDLKALLHKSHKVIISISQV